MTVAEPERTLPGHGIHEGSSAEELLAWALTRFQRSRVLITTAFGMEGCALIDLVARQRVPVKVFYLDTRFLFPETYALKARLAARYPHLTFLDAGSRLSPEEQAELHGPALWRHDPDLCCQLRKIEPMRRLLRRADVWITAVRRDQSPSRQTLRAVEWDYKFDVLKVSPLAAWTRGEVWNHVLQEGVPYNPLHERGYPTLGCTHCTRPLAGLSPHEYSREGRWSGFAKTECGLHSR